MEKGNPKVEIKYKMIVDALSVPALVFKLDRQNNLSIVKYFNTAFKKLNTEYVLFPADELKVGVTSDLFDISPGTKLRRISTVLDGLQKITKSEIGTSHSYTLSLIKNPENGNKLDVTALEQGENQDPYKITLIKLDEDLLGVLYEKIKTSSENGIALDLNNLVSLSSASQGALILKDGIVRYVNVYLLEILGYENASDIMNHPIEDFIMKDDREEFLLQIEHLDDSESVETTCRFNTKGGSSIWLRLNCGIFNLGKKYGYSIVINVVDITEQKKTELALFQTHRMASIGELSSGVAHEINNPLFGIMNYSGLVKDAIDEGVIITKDSEEYEFITGIVEESERISKIVNNLSEFSRNSDDREFDETDLEDVIEKVEGFLSHQLKRAQVKIEKDIKKDFPKKIPLQKQRIRTALFNMVLNSTQAVKSVKDREHRIKITLDIEKKNGSSCAKIVVWDNGIGIKEDELVKVFDPFYTSNRPQKTGLGLHTVYQIIKDHHGDVRVSSKLGEWTEFIIRLPLQTAKPKKS